MEAVKGGVRVVVKGLNGLWDDFERDMRMIGIMGWESKGLWDGNERGAERLNMGHCGWLAGRYYEV